MEMMAECLASIKSRQLQFQAIGIASGRCLGYARQVMKRFVFVFLALGMGSLFARSHNSDSSLAPAPTDLSAAFAERPPDEESPFFLDPQLSRKTTRAGFGDGKTDETVAQYPKVKGSSDTALNMFTGYFTGMFSSVNFKSLQTAPETAKLKVEPDAFHLQDRRELNVTYSIFNNTKNLSRIEYPTSQRIEILTYDSQGKVIDRWSDDHSFTKQEGIVILNPHERIEYQEKIPTREMKVGETYKIEATVASEPNFLSKQTVSAK